MKKHQVLNRQMRIAHLTPTFSAFSGIDRVVQRLATEQVLSGNDVSIFALEADMEPPENVELHIIAMPRNPTLQRIYRLIMPIDIYKGLKWSSQLKHFDIIYSHYYPMTWLGYLAKKLYRVKHIYYNYGINYPELFPSLMERTYLRIFVALANWTIKRADGAISISHFLKEQLERETGLTGDVVYPTIDTERFHRGLDSAIIRHKYNLENIPIILYVGRISPHKGVHLLIEAFNLVKNEISNARLLIVGKHTFPGYTKRLKQMTDDSVVFADYVPDEEIPYFYSACDIYATGTMWEGFNLPLAEAQACGKPVVAFNMGPHPEVVKNADAGILASPGDVTSLANAMINLLRNKKKTVHSI